MFSKCTALKTFTIPEGVETIYLNAFYESGLQSLYLPANIKEMKSYLWGIEVNDVFIPSLEAWMNIRRDESTCSFFIGNLHIDGKVLSDLYVPEGVTEIPLCCFSGVKSLSSVHLPNSISKIDSYSFYYCENLKDVEIKDDVTSIGDYAFAYCPLSSTLVSLATCRRRRIHYQPLYGRLDIPVDYICCLRPHNRCRMESILPFQAGERVIALPPN